MLAFPSNVTFFQTLFFKPPPVKIMLWCLYLPPQVWQKGVDRAFMAIYISLGHPLGAHMEQIRTFSGFSQFFIQGTKISFHRGGVCAYFLKSVRKGRFRNVWVKGDR